MRLPEESLYIDPAYQGRSPGGVQVYSEDEHGNPIYDFSRINRIYGEFVKRGMKPVVECDYMPKGLTNGEIDASFGNDEGMSVRNEGPAAWDRWRELLVAFTENLANYTIKCRKNPI